jgi:cytochrome P450
MFTGRCAEHDEVAKGKNDGEALTWEDLSKLKYTWRVAQETLRLIPPIFGNFQTAVRDTEFEGYTIPEGWQVFWTAGVTHMDAAIFPDPAKLDPSRFETTQPSAAPPCSFVAFGGGARICVGMEFARIETLVTMYHLVRRFRWRLRCKEDTFARDPLPSPLHGLPVED